MTINVTLSDDVANYLEQQSLAQNKSRDQLADELLRQIIEADDSSAGKAQAGETGGMPHLGVLDSNADGKCLNQILDDLYVEDYIEKARR